MSRLASHAELVKLSAVLEVPESELEFLSEATAEPLRLLRESITEYLLEEDRGMFRSFAKVAARVPIFALTKIAQSIDPLLVSGIATELNARRAVAIATKLPTTFLADVCVYLDPRRARDLIRLIPADTIVDIALELDSRDDFVSMSRFVDFLSDDEILAVEEAIPDETRLLRITYLMESKNRVDHIFKLLPSERIQRLLVKIQQDPDALLDEFLSLLVHVSYGFKRQLGDVLAAQSEDLINMYILGVDRRSLWTDVLPVVGAMSVPARTRVVNLPALREEKVQYDILQTADQEDMWGQVLAMVALMGSDNRRAVAHIIANTDLALRAPVHAALIGEYWEILLDLVTHMPANKQAEFVAIIDDIATIDEPLANRIRNDASALGIAA